MSIWPAPISIDSRNNTTASQGGGRRPNSTGISSATPGGANDRINGWFNTAAFADAPTFTFGNIGRFLPGNFGPGMHNWDVSILKDFPITGHFRLQFRGELFNVFNLVNFRLPGHDFRPAQLRTHHRRRRRPHHPVRLEAY
jgi:hypothetical protein